MENNALENKLRIAKYSQVQGKKAIIELYQIKNRHSNIDNEKFAQLNTRMSSSFGAALAFISDLPVNAPKSITKKVNNISQVSVDVDKLDPESGRQLYVPRGFAHGFAVLSDVAVFQYKCDNFYHPEADAGIQLLDEDLGIDWRIPMERAILSEKDLRHARLCDAVLDFDINDNLY